MQTLTLKAPAKLNLYLDVLNKRPDGFHNIETVFEKLNLFDKITLSRRKTGIKVVCRHKDVPADKRNLAHRAAQALLAKTRPNAGVQIKISKRIPVAAGLGGGSSDAASVLLGLNRLFSLKQKPRQLLEIGAKLGADVPFFLCSRSRAIGRGKGERLTSLKVKSKNWYILVIPRGLNVSTRRMYSALRIPLTKRPAGVKIVFRALEKGDLTTLDRYSYNSFEPILRKKYKQIQRIKKALKSYGAGATLVSGSGPCVFGVVASRKEAMVIGRTLGAKARNWQVIVASTFDSKKEE